MRCNKSIDTDNLSAADHFRRLAPGFFNGEKVFWFPATKHGWGWAPPTAWQGRWFLGIWIVTVVILSPLLHQRSGFQMFILFFLPMLALLLAVCFVKGERRGGANEPPDIEWTGLKYVLTS